jgi:nitrite reductase/ring-hydroxylating ferredoxin subunit
VRLRASDAPYVVTCPLHRAQFDVTTGKNVGGIQIGMPAELVQRFRRK